MLLLCVSMTSAVTVSNDVYAGLTNGVIANYMSNNFLLQDSYASEDRIYFDYSLVSIYRLNETHVSTDLQNYSFSISYDDYYSCTSFNTESECVTYLYNGTQKYVLDNGTVNFTYTPVEYQAFNLGLSFYYDALDLRDNIAKKNALLLFLSLILGV